VMIAYKDGLHTVIGWSYVIQAHLVWRVLMEGIVSREFAMLIIDVDVLLISNSAIQQLVVKVCVLYNTA